MQPDSRYNYNSTDKELIASIAKKRLPNIKQLKYLGRFLKPKELILLLTGCLFIIAGITVLLTNVYKSNIQLLPSDGGRYIEGSVGSPQFINPLYATLNSVDSDIAKLVYSGLFTRNEKGILTKDIVENYSISEDGKIYTFQIKKGINFNENTNTGDPKTDTEELTADDIIFTIETIQDSSFHSPLRQELLGVEAEKIDDYNFKLTLPERYAPFLDSLTFGIMPKSAWEELSPASINLAELNIKPIGSGPFHFASVLKDKSGNIISYTLAANDYYYGQKAHLKNIVFKFLPSAEELVAAINNGQVDGVSYLSADQIKNISAKNYYNFHYLNIPQNTALFFNLRDKGTWSADKKVREALLTALPKEDIVKNFSGSATISNSPITASSIGYNNNIYQPEFNLAKAKTLLAEAGYKENTSTSTTEIVLEKAGKALEIKITVADEPELIKLAENIAEAWKKLNIKVSLETVNKNDLQSQVIKPKNFSVILYSWLVGVDPDPYLVWHSSQIGEKGMNLSGYNNPKIDKLLEEARLDSNLENRQKYYNEFQQTIVSDIPAIFLYTPYYIYPQSKKVRGFVGNTITSPEDRFASANLWYVKQKRALK